MLKKLFLLVLLIMSSEFVVAQNFWERIQSPTENFLRTLHFSDSLRGWVAGDSGGVFYTSDGGLTWDQQQTNTNSKIIRLFFLNDERGWAVAWADAGVGENAFYGTEILKTTDGGQNWSVQQYRDENTFMRGIYFLDTLLGFMGGVPAEFLKSTDGGLNWEPANIDSGTFSHFPVINYKFYNQQYGFACGGRFDIAGVIWRTTNGGENWTPMDAQYSPADEVWDIHFFDSLNVMGIGGDPDVYGVGLINSSDAGLTWDYYEIGIFGQAQAISFRTQVEGWAVVPLSQTFVTTFDAGENWFFYPTPDSSTLYDITFTDSLTGYAVGEEGVIAKYKYRSPDNVIDNFVDTPSDFLLYQNFPNPFNPSTTISYYLAESGDVSITIFDPLGNHIVEIEKEFKSAGNYNFVWNAADKSSGVYYVQLIYNNRITTGKMVLLK